MSLTQAVAPLKAVLRHSLRTLVWLAAFSCAACKRSEPSAKPPPETQSPNEPASRDPDAGPRPALSRAGMAIPEAKISPPKSAPTQPPRPTRSAAELLAAYRSEPDLAMRRSILADLAFVPPEPGVAAIGELLKAEKQPEMRVALLDQLDSYEGQAPQKIALLRTELLDHRTTGDVRDAAIDALLNIQDRAAIPLWQALLQSSDESLHDVARQAVAALEAL